MEAKKVIDSVFSYLEKNMVPGMSDLQEIAFYAIKEAIDEEYESLIENVKSKPFIRALAAIDKDGNVDIEKLAQRLRKGIECKGSLSFDIPLYGQIKFVTEDIDNILLELKGAVHNEGYQNIGRPY